MPEIPFMPVESFRVSSDLELPVEALDLIRSVVRKKRINPQSWREDGYHASIVNAQEVRSATPDGHDGYDPGIVSAYVAEHWGSDALDLGGAGELDAFGNGKNARLIYRLRDPQTVRPIKIIRDIVADYLAENGAAKPAAGRRFIPHITIGITPEAHTLKKDRGFVRDISEVFDASSIGVPKVSYVSKTWGPGIVEPFPFDTDLQPLIANVDSPDLAPYDIDYVPGKGIVHFAPPEPDHFL